MRIRMASAVKAAVLVVATVVAIGSLELYTGRGALAQFSELPLPHFKCYNFVPAGPPVKEPVALTDQFGTDPSVTVENRHYLCAPVNKTHGTTVTETNLFRQHLVCYHIRPSLGALKTNVMLTDQFRAESGEITTPHLLCAPADKQLLPG